MILEILLLLNIITETAQFPATFYHRTPKTNQSLTEQLLWP